jgi:hypothetical protein
VILTRDLSAVLDGVRGRILELKRLSAFEGIILKLNWKSIAAHSLS